MAHQPARLAGRVVEDQRLARHHLTLPQGPPQRRVLRAIRCAVGTAGSPLRKELLDVHADERRLRIPSPRQVHHLAAPAPLREGRAENLLLRGATLGILPDARWHGKCFLSTVVRWVSMIA